jgi:phospholipid/cholesterol/gamma-HCH transport system substrate-binding protein
MASKKTKFTVGLFVAGGIGFALLAIIWLGMSRFLAKGQNYVTYFNESVQGLDIESPVKYRGVSIGRVRTIGVAPDSKLIEVVLKIESGQTLGSDVVAQLKSVGITGSMFVELDKKKEGELDRSPALLFPAEYPIVASKPSEISELVRGLDDVLKQIRSLDLTEISDKIKLNLDDINQMIRDADVKGISKDMRSSLMNVDRVFDDERWDNIMATMEQAGQSINVLLGKANRGLTRVEDIVSGNEAAIGTAIDDFKRAMATANVFLEKGSALVSGTDDSQAQLRRHLLVIAQNMERASENLQRLIDLLSDQPSQLVFGDPPVPRKVEREID